MSKFPPLYYECPDGHRTMNNAICNPFSCETTIDDTSEECCGLPVGPCHIGGKIPGFIKERGHPVFAKVDDFGTGDGRIKGAWMDEIVDGRRSIYISCGRCGAINDLSDLRITPSGQCNCFHCGRCQCDHFVRLEEYRELLDVPRKFLDPRYKFACGIVTLRPV